MIVTPSVYGTENAATLYGMQARGADARGVAVIDDQTPESALDAMGQAGVRGIRLNLATAGITDPAVARQRFQAAVARMQRRQWHVQLNTTLAIITALKDLVTAAPVPVVFDHFGGAKAELGLAYGQNIRTHLLIGGYASTIVCASACLPLPSDPYSA